MKNIFMLLIFMLLGSSLFAQNRMVYDSTFGVNGVAAYSGYSWDGYGFLLVQPDDKILSVGGKKLGNNNSDIQLLRQLPNGDLDTSFNHTGRVVITNPYSHYFALTDALIQPDGKILVAGSGGTATQYNSNSVLSRYNANGSLDTLFGDHGWVVQSWDSLYVYKFPISLLPDGKILGASQPSDFPDSAPPKLFRWQANGQPDPTFGVNGAVDVPPGYISSLSSMEIDPSGNIVLMGRDMNLQTFSSALVIIQPDGSFGASYPISSVGSWNLDPPSFSSLAIQPDGKILLGGQFDLGNSIMLRLNSDGTLNTTFNRDGIFTESLDSNFGFGLGQIILTPEGKIIVLSNVLFGMIGLNSNGSLDYNFNGNGIFDPPAIGISSHVGNSNRPFGIALQSDGKLLQGVIDDGKFYMRRFASQVCSE